MNKWSENKVPIIIIFIIIFLASTVYIKMDKEREIQTEQIKIAQEKEKDATKEIERIKAEKEAIKKQYQEEKATMQKSYEEKKAEESIRQTPSKMDNASPLNYNSMYTNYYNNTFGFSIDIPTNFNVQTNNTKGIILISPDNQGQIFVVGSYKTDNETNRQMYEEQLSSAKNAGGNVTYNICGDDWFVISWEIGGVGNYMKKFTNYDSELLYVVMFPMTQLETYSSIIEHMESTFRRNKY